MRKSVEIRQALSEALEALKAESRADEQKTLTEKVRQLMDELKAAQTVEEAQRLAAATKAGVSDAEKKEMRKYSIAKALRERMAGKELTGLELEMHQEAAREMAEIGVTMRGIGIPSAYLRAIPAQNVSEAGKGDAFVTTTFGNYFEELKNALLGTKLGVHYLEGLVGYLKMPKGKGFTAEWLAEGAEATAQVADFSSVTMTPHRLACLGAITADLLRSSHYSVDEIVMSQILDAHARALDSAIFNGTGTGAQPTGILNTTGVNKVAITKVPTFAQVVEMETKIAAKNGIGSKMAYVTNGTVNGTLKTTPLVSSFPSFLLNNGQLNGYNVEVSETIGANKLILGDFDKVFVGQWGALDVAVDPYTQMDRAIVRMCINAYHDIFVQYPEAFSVGTIATS